MARAVKMLRLCSLNLQVLKLDGNYLSSSTLGILLSTLRQQIGGSNSLQVLSLSDCGIEESKKEMPFQIKALFELIEGFSSSLISLDLSYNHFGRYFIEHLPRVINLSYFAAKCCFDK